MTEAIAEKVEGKHCRDCGGWKRWRTGEIGFDEMAQCRYRAWNPCANHPACDKFRERAGPVSPDRTACPEFMGRMG